MIPSLAQAGYRVIVPDFIGRFFSFNKSTRFDDIGQKAKHFKGAMFRFSVFDGFHYTTILPPPASKQRG
jgi:dienelactone hydrolase